MPKPMIIEENRRASSLARSFPMPLDDILHSADLMPMPGTSGPCKRLENALAMRGFDPDSVVDHAKADFTRWDIART